MNHNEINHVLFLRYEANRARTTLFTMVLLFASLIYPAIIALTQGKVQVAALFFALSSILLLIPVFNKLKKTTISVGIAIHVCNIAILMFNVFIAQNVLNLFSLFPLAMGIFYLNPLPIYNKELVFHYCLTIFFTILSVLYFYLVPVNYYKKESNDLFAIINLLVCLFVTIALIYLQGNKAVKMQLRINKKIAENNNLVNELEATINQKNILLAEAHHRIKNNLAIVSGILNWQKSTSPLDKVHEVLSDCSNRVMSIALVHKKLYERGDYDEIALNEYIKELCDDIKTAQPAYSAIEIEENLEQNYIKVEKATPCGLIINEVVTNSFKHAFKDNRGKITISLKKMKNIVILIIKDNGVGMPPIKKIATSNTMGFNLITSLTEQIDGHFEYINSNGTQFVLYFPLN